MADDSFKVKKILTPSERRWFSMISESAPDREELHEAGMHLSRDGRTLYIKDENRAFQYIDETIISEMRPSGPGLRTLPPSFSAIQFEGHFVNKAVEIPPGETIDLAYSPEAPGRAPMDRYERLRGTLDLQGEMDSYARGEITPSELSSRATMRHGGSVSDQFVYRGIPSGSSAGTGPFNSNIGFAHAQAGNGGVIEAIKLTGDEGREFYPGSERSFRSYITTPRNAEGYARSDSGMDYNVPEDFVEQRRAQGQIFRTNISRPSPVLEISPVGMSRREFEVNPYRGSVTAPASRGGSPMRPSLSDEMIPFFPANPPRHLVYADNGDILLMTDDLAEAREVLSRAPRELKLIVGNAPAYMEDIGRHPNMGDKIPIPEWMSDIEIDEDVVLGGRANPDFVRDRSAEPPSYIPEQSDILERRTPSPAAPDAPSRMRVAGRVFGTAARGLGTAAGLAGTAFEAGRFAGEVGRHGPVEGPKRYFLGTAEDLGGMAQLPEALAENNPYLDPVTRKTAEVLGSGGRALQRGARELRGDRQEMRGVGLDPNVQGLDNSEFSRQLDRELGLMVSELVTPRKTRAVFEPVEDEDDRLLRNQVSLNPSGD